MNSMRVGVSQVYIRNHEKIRLAYWILLILLQDEIHMLKIIGSIFNSNIVQNLLFTVFNIFGYFYVILFF